MNRLINAFSAILFVIVGIIILGPIIGFLFKSLAKIIWPNCDRLNFPGPYLYYCQDDSTRIIYSSYMFITMIASFFIGAIKMFVIWTSFTKVVDRYIKR